jgi:hypothetical protein
MPSLFWFLLVCVAAGGAFVFYLLLSLRERVDAAGFAELHEKLKQVIGNPADTSSEKSLLALCETINDELKWAGYQVTRSKLVSAVFGILMLYQKSDSSLPISDYLFKRLANLNGEAYPLRAHQERRHVFNAESVFSKHLNSGEKSRLFRHENDPWKGRISSLETGNSPASPLNENDGEGSNPLFETNQRLTSLDSDNPGCLPQWIFPSFLLFQKTQIFAVSGYPGLNFLMRFAMTIGKFVWWLWFFFATILWLIISAKIANSELGGMALVGFIVGGVAAFLVVLLANLMLALQLAFVEGILVVLKIEENTRSQRQRQ